MFLDIFYLFDKFDFSQFIPFIPLPTIGVGGGIEANEQVDLIATLKSTFIFLAGFGLFFGAGLALAARRFAVKVDPKIEMVREVLAGAQCGACGFAGCQAYAEAVVNDPSVSPSLCTPGKEATAEAVAMITGKEMTALEPKIARVLCQGGKNRAAKKFIYEGIKDCRAAVLAGGGDKACMYGCLGYGTCASVCPFDAITMSEDGLPIIDPKKCTACYTCVNACPKKIIEVLPICNTVLVRCRSLDKGATVKKYCQVGCIGCGICEKVCPFDAVKVENNLARIDTSKCMVCGLCAQKCPTNAILDTMPERKKASVTDECIGCGRCASVCPVNAAFGEKKEHHHIDQTKCIGCGICALKCPVLAITGTFNCDKLIKEAQAKKAKQLNKAVVNA